MRRALHAEWTKLCTVPAAGWLLLGEIAVTVAASAAATATAGCHSSAGCHPDVARIALTGTDVGQSIAAIVGVQAISGEYATGMMATTLAALPRRTAVLAAKAAVVTGPVLAASAVAALGCLLAGRLILPGRGLGPAAGYPALSLADGSVLRAVAGSALYLTLIALLGLGIAAIVRDAAVAVGVVLGLLYLFPILAAVVSSPAAHRQLEQIGPLTAGLSVQATTDLASLPIGPWAGLGVAGAWAAAALLGGAVLLHLRDA